MAKTKVLIAIVIVLLVLNTATLVFFWLHRPPRPGPTDRQGQDPGVVLARELGFSEQQHQRFETLRAAHHAEMVVYGDSLRLLKDSLFTLLLNQDTVHSGGIFSAIGTVHQKVEQVTFEHFQQVRQLCTPEQRRRYDKMLFNAFSGPERARVRNDKGQPPQPDKNDPDKSVMPPDSQTGRREPGGRPPRPPPNLPPPEKGR